MKCPKCQADNREGVKFCEECGARMEIVCPSCGQTIPLGKKFCGECGQELAASAEQLPKELSFEEKLDKIQRYLPGGLTEKILAQRGKIEGERKQVTVMFCDMEEYTALSEKLGPEDVYSVMDEVYEILIRKVHDYGGTVNELTGDGIVALFGAPIAVEDAPQRAALSALAIHREMEGFSERIKEKIEIPPIKMRIGIHTGPVVVGTIGNDLRVEFKAVGDTVNLSSRMEALAEPGTTYITRDTYRLIGSYFEFSSLGKVEVKGKKEPVEAYQVLGMGPARSRIEAAEARGLTEFVGRRRELENLTECFARAKAGHGQAVGIVGEAGVGKSRLVLEFRKSIDTQDLTYLEGPCVSFGQSVPYLPFIEIIKLYFGIEEGDRAFTVRKKVRTRIADLDKALTEAIPFLCGLLSAPVDDSAFKEMGPEEKRKLAFEAVKALFLRESQARPLIIALDNLQWIDKASQELLNYLVESIASARILLLCIYRPGYVHRWSNKSYYSHIALNPLSEEESAALARVILDIEEVTADLRRLVLGRAEGNPLYVEEIVRWLLESGALARTEDGHVLRETPVEMPVPDTIQDVIMARIDRLEQDIKQTMQTASVIGRDFLFRLLTKISDREKELQNYLARLQSLEFIYEKSLFPELEYMFKHGLIQDVAYHSLLIRTRKQLHERIGNAMEELYKDRLDEHYEELAHHYLQSDNQEKAIEYLVLAAKKAADRFANQEAMAFCEQALKVLEKLPDTEENRKLRSEIEFLMLGLKALADDIPPI